jgi:hypothetical protein
MDVRQHLNVIFGPRYRGLISCQHCGHAVASEARRCPSCGGRPIERPRPIAMIFFLFLLSIFAIGYLHYPVWFFWALFATAVIAIRASYIIFRYTLQRQATRTGPWSH